MKFKTLFGILVSVFVAVPSHAQPASGGSGVQFVITSENVLSYSNWSVLFPNLPKGIKGIYISNTATSQAIEVGIAYANAPTNAEVRQLVIPAAQSLVGYSQANYIPLVVGYGARVSIRAISSTATNITSGEVDMSLLYNSN